MRSAVLLTLAMATVVAGCSRNSGGDSSLLPPAPSSSPLATQPEVTFSPPPVVRTTAGPSQSASATTFPESQVVACGGRPSAEQVISVVRRQRDLLPSGVGLSAKTGPLCAGTWQYTVLNVTDHEPLQVVTRGAPGSLTFVTAGTSVCTVEVRASAPVALLTAANC